MKLHSEDHLPEKHIRPRFIKDTDYSVDELVEKVSNKLKDENSYCVGVMKHGYATIRIPEEDQHYWSPQLTLTCDKDDDQEEGSTIRGVYGPRPAVWTMFIFFYIVIGMAIMIISLVGFSHMSLGNSYNILWLVPFLTLLLLTIFLVAKQGKKMGHDQMVKLHEFIEDAIGVDIYEN